jgi:hypothetical protein
MARFRYQEEAHDHYDREQDGNEYGSIYYALRDHALPPADDATLDPVAEELLPLRDDGFAFRYALEISVMRLR